MRALCALVSLAALGTPPVSSDQEADALAQVFLEHMRSIGPVAGRFTLESHFDPTEMERFRRIAERDAEQRGLTLATSPNVTVLNCEWAWDGIRETLKTREGSNIFEQFHRTPEACLRGMAEDNYNLDVPRSPAPWRPASFYVMAGIIPWEEYLQEVTFSLGDPPPDDPPGTRLLIARRPDREMRLLVEPSTGIMHRYEIDLDGKPFARVSIDRFARSDDGRVYPAAARATILNQGRLLKEITLTAERVVFRPDEVESVMTLVVPAGATVHDRLLKRRLPIHVATPADQILADQVAAEPEADAVPLPTLPSPTLASIDTGERGAKPLWAWALGVIALAAVGLFCVLRGAKLMGLAPRSPTGKTGI